MKRQLCRILLWGFAGFGLVSCGGFAVDPDTLAANSMDATQLFAHGYRYDESEGWSKSPVRSHSYHGVATHNHTDKSLKSNHGKSSARGSNRQYAGAGGKSHQGQQKSGTHSGRSNKKSSYSQAQNKTSTHKGGGAIHDRPL